MNFVWIAIFAYVLFAVNAVIDKFLLHKKRIDEPATYAFAIGVLSLAAIVLIPFGFTIPSVDEAMLSLTAGIFFTFALYLFFSALKLSEASRVVPVQGGFVPFFTLIFAYFVIGERLTADDLLAFGLLVAGSVLIGKGSKGRKGSKRRNWISYALGAALLFAMSFTMTKAVFETLGFINGFIWTRLGMAAGALLLFTDPKSRQAILVQIHSTSHNTGTLFIAGQIIGALAGMAQNFAIAQGSVTIVNALQGTQFVFVLGLTAFLSLWHPQILKEESSQKILIRKIAAVALISIGVAVLAV